MQGNLRDPGEGQSSCCFLEKRTSRSLEAYTFQAIKQFNPKWGKTWETNGNNKDTRND